MEIKDSDVRGSNIYLDGTVDEPSGELLETQVTNESSLKDQGKEKMYLGDFLRATSLREMDVYCHKTILEIQLLHLLNKSQKALTPSAAFRHHSISV
ncbi:hypothetical protein TNCV_3898781 [Trichonephila clavipes]|nr:hypothetical protein TNCV_3898781 [Trichonephila clavipes]